MHCCLYSIYTKHYSILRYSCVDIFSYFTSSQCGKLFFCSHFIHRVFHILTTFVDRNWVYDRAYIFCTKIR